MLIKPITKLILVIVEDFIKVELFMHPVILVIMLFIDHFIMNSIMVKPIMVNFMFMLFLIVGQLEHFIILAIIKLLAV